MHRYILFILTAIVAGRPSADAQSQHRQQKVNYSIDVTLTDSTHSLDGRIRIGYINLSPDTLSFIWIRCWPNAFRNDRTAFSEQLIRSGRTDFYFSDKSRKGYINRLDFQVDGQPARMEDHPLYIDVVKIILPRPLPPGDSTTLTTPFHIQLPDNFSNYGYREGIYAVTQWYPKPAVYDASGWHPDPYVGQDDYHNGLSEFDVHLTVPANFVIAATTQPLSSITTKSTTSPQSTTLSFHQSNIPDFVWFASRRFQTTHDTLHLPSGRTIDLYAYYLKKSSPLGQHAIAWLKDALLFYPTSPGF